LTSEQQDRLRRLARRSPAFLGMKIQVHDDHVEVLEPHDLELGFETLAARLLDTPEDDWADAVDDYFRYVIDVITSDAAELDGPTEDVLGHVYQRLLPSDMEFFPEYAFPIAPDLVWTLAFDRPDTIAVLNDEHVQRHGFERLSEAGLANLCREVPEQVAVGEGDINVLEGSDYVGSLLLVMPWLTELICAEPEPPYGVLVGAPSRNVTIFHMIRGGVESRYAIGEIGRIAAECADDASHPLSRAVHWWRPGRLEPVTGPNGMEAAAELDAVLRELS
jgi:hypothetical protein